MKPLAPSGPKQLHFPPSPKPPFRYHAKVEIQQRSAFGRDGDNRVGNALLVGLGNGNIARINVATLGSPSTYRTYAKEDPAYTQADFKCPAHLKTPGQREKMATQLVDALLPAFNDLARNADKNPHWRHDFNRRFYNEMQTRVFPDGPRATATISVDWDSKPSADRQNSLFQPALKPYITAKAFSYRDLKSGQKRFFISQLPNRESLKPCFYLGHLQFYPGQLLESSPTQAALRRMMKGEFRTLLDHIARQGNQAHANINR